MNQRIKKYVLIIVIIVVNILAITITTISVFHSINRLLKTDGDKQEIVQNETTIEETDENTVG